MKNIRYVSLCSGYGAECLAFKRLRRDYPGFDFDCLAWSEIEPNAMKAHDALHPEYAGRNLGDMTCCNYLDITGPVDILFYSTPCQSVSRAGRNAGMKKGDDSAASALIWHTERAIRELRPRICILENVKGMVEPSNRPDFEQWCQVLESYGYINFWQILNAKDFGVAQNRERIFMVSILRTEAEPCPQYHFPNSLPLTKFAKDYMEPIEGIDESYFISPEKATAQKIAEALDHPSIRAEVEGIYHREWRHFNEAETVGAFDEMQSKIIKVCNLQNGRVFHSPQNARVYSPKGIAPTLMAAKGQPQKYFVVRPKNDESDTTGSYIPNPTKEDLLAHFGNRLAVRHATPREALRLMDVEDSDIDKIMVAEETVTLKSGEAKTRKAVSKTAQYTLAGNSIVVACLYHIFRTLLLPNQPENRVENNPQPRLL